MEKVYIVHHVKLEENIVDAMDNVRDYVFKDFDSAKSFVEKYRTDEQWDVICDFQYKINSNKGEYQYLLIKEYKLNKETPALKYSLG